MTPLKAGQGALLSAVLSYSGNWKFYSDSLRIYKSMQSKMRNFPPIPTVFDAADREPKGLNLIFRQFTQLVVKGLNLGEVVGAKCPVNIRPIRHVA
jgi:hypothetical protein